MTSENRRVCNAWNIHCKNVYAASQKRGECLSRKDILQQASTTYTKQVKPRASAVPITWYQHVRDFSTFNRVSYKNAMVSCKRKEEWKDKKRVASSGNLKDLETERSRTELAKDKRATPRPTEATTTPPPALPDRDFVVIF